MAYRFEFDSTHRIVRCKVTLQVTDEELADCYQTIALVCEALDPEVGIADFSDATSFATAGKVRALANLAPALPEPSRPRFVVASSDHIYGLARLFQIEGEATRPNLHIVRSSADALAMLEIDEPQFGPLSKALGSRSVPRGAWEERD